MKEDSTIEQYRELIKKYNLKQEGSGSGKNIYLHCPFHDDRKPSLSINRENGRFNCFNPECRCNESKFKDGGKQDVIFFEKLLENIDEQFNDYNE
ncbi:CHC2 zinc finger domain-containing protein [Cetobacterium sp.]|uniref:CHC2 zinc finger domain-containing protein n=1 Tax=Cetobacterium sp. TaxID=2071632 RepID=UPI003F2D258B